MIVTSFQDLKSFGKTDFSATFSCFVINSAFLYHFLTNLLAHSKKMSEQSVYREALSPEITSPLVFGLVVLQPTGSEISRFWYSKTRGRKIAIESFFCSTYQYVCNIHFKLLLSIIVHRVPTSSRETSNTPGAINLTNTYSARQKFPFLFCSVRYERFPLKRSEFVSRLNNI